MNLFDILLEWTINTFSPLGSLGLFILAFIESSFFYPPPDVLLIVLTLAEPNKAFWFALICSIGSVLGGMLGYGIGYFLEQTVLEKFFSKKKIERVHEMYSKYDTLAIFIGGYTPLPYKIFTISAGLFYINFKKFIIVSTIARSLRFFTIATLLYFYGEVIVEFLHNYFNWITVIAAVTIIIVFICYRRLKNYGLDRL